MNNISNSYAWLGIWYDVRTFYNDETYRNIDVDKVLDLLNE